MGPCKGWRGAGWPKDICTKSDGFRKGSSFPHQTQVQVCKGLAQIFWSLCRSHVSFRQSWDQFGLHCVRQPGQGPSDLLTKDDLRVRRSDVSGPLVSHDHSSFAHVHQQRRHHNDTSCRTSWRKKRGSTRRPRQKTSQVSLHFHSGLTEVFSDNLSLSLTPMVMCLSWQVSLRYFHYMLLQRL